MGNEVHRHSIIDDNWMRFTWGMAKLVEFVKFSQARLRKMRPEFRLFPDQFRGIFVADFVPAPAFVGELRLTDEQWAAASITGV